MLNFELYIPTKLYFGRGQCGRVGEIAAGRGFRRALICYGGGSAVRSGAAGAHKDVAGRGLGGV